MALTQKGQAWDYGVSGVSAAGIVSVTGFTITDEFGTTIEGVDVNGEVASFLYGKTKFTLSVEGYCAPGQAPTIGGSITIAGVIGTIIKSEKTGSNQDLSHYKAEGPAYPAIAG
jgi:hypothetical protein